MIFRFTAYTATVKLHVLLPTTVDGKPYHYLLVPVHTSDLPLFSSLFSEQKAIGNSTDLKPHSQHVPAKKPVPKNKPTRSPKLV
jgi:hypothetical protein